MAELIRKQTGDLVTLHSPQLEMFPGLRHAYFTRHGGVSQGVYESMNFRFAGTDSRENVLENHRIAAAFLGGDGDRLARTTQMHTDNIVVVEDVDGFTSIGDGVDALITATPGLVLAGYFADCQLVMLYDRKTNVCALAHSGWRGVVNGIVPKTIAKMQETFGTKPADLIVAVGPSICRSCFETNDDVPTLLREAYGDMVRDYLYREGEKWHIDLRCITHMLLLRAGVQPMNIDLSNDCTKCDRENLFWSHRRHGNNRGVQAGMIMLRK